MVSSERANPKPDVRDKIISHLSRHMAEAFNISSGTKNKQSLSKKGSSNFINGGNGSDHSLFLSPMTIENLENLEEEITNVTKPSTAMSVESTKIGYTSGIGQIETAEDLNSIKNATGTEQTQVPLLLKRKIRMDPFSDDQLKIPILPSATFKATQSATI